MASSREIIEQKKHENENFMMRMRKDLKRRLRKTAEDHHTTMSIVVSSVLEKELPELEKEKK